jgi:hypothetical protein
MHREAKNIFYHLMEGFTQGWIMKEADCDRSSFLVLTQQCQDL